MGLPPQRPVDHRGKGFFHFWADNIMIDLIQSAGLGIGDCLTGLWGQVYRAFRNCFAGDKARTGP